MDPLQLLQQLLEQSGAERRQAALQQQLAMQRVGQRTLPQGLSESATYHEAPTDRMPLYDYLGSGGRGMAKPRSGMMDEHPPTKLNTWQEPGGSVAADAPQPEMQLIPSQNIPLANTGYGGDVANAHQAKAEHDAGVIRRKGYAGLFRADGGATHQQALDAIIDQLNLQRSRAGNELAFYGWEPQL